MAKSALSTIEIRVRMDKMYNQALQRSSLGQSGPTPADKAAIAISHLRTESKQPSIRSAANWFMLDNFSIGSQETGDVSGKIACTVIGHIINDKK